MSAINFVVRDVAGNISRGTVAGEGVPSSLIVGAGADVSLNLTRGQIISYTRQGQALEITLIDGRTIVIEGFFTMEGVSENELFLSADGYTTEVDLTQGAGADYYANYLQLDNGGKFALNDDLTFMRSADVMLADSYVPADDQVGMLGAMAPLFGWGGAAAAGAAALVTTLDGDGPGVPAPEVNLTDGVEGTGDVINQQDHADGVEIAGTGTPGATVDVLIDGVTHTTVVADDGTWSVLFATGEIATGEYETPVSVTITNEGGSVTVTDVLVVDTIIGADIEASGGADGVINFAEYDGGVTLTGTVTGGDAVVVTIDGVDYDAVVSGTSWSLALADGVLASGEYEMDVVVTSTDAAGNSYSTSSTIVVDTVADVTVDTSMVGGVDGVINATEHGGVTTLTGSVTGADSVVVTIDGTDYTATVTDGSWSLDLAAGVLAAGEYDMDIVVTATDAAGNSSSATGTIVVDTITDVTVDTSAVGGADGIVGGSEQSGGVMLTGTAQPGATVVVTLGTVSHTVTATAAGTWSSMFTSSEVPTGELDVPVNVTATDAAGNTASASSSITVDTITDVTVDTASVGGADGVVNGAEHPGGVTLTGTAQPGATVVVTLGTVSHTVTATAAGTWSSSFTSVEVPEGELDVPVNVTATDAAGNTATASGSVEVDTLVNNLSITGNSAGGADGVVNFDESGQAITMTGTVEAGSTVSVNLHGVVMNATVDASGNWSVTYPGGTLPGGEYDTTVVVTATDMAGNSSALTEAVTVDTVAGDLALSTSPIELDDVVNFVEASDGVIISGTATPGLVVTVGLGDSTLNVLSQPDGTWSVNFPASMVPADTDSAPITASITDPAGNYREVSDTVAIDTVVEPHEFSSAPIEGDNVINGAEAADGVVLSGTVEAGSSVVVEFGGQAITVLAGADGTWSASFPASAISGTEYTATMTATATDPAGNVSVITDTVQVDTIVNELTTTDPVAGDNVVDGAEAAAGVTLGGTVEAGSTVVVTFAHPGGVITRDATVDANGNWSLTYAGGEVPGGEYDANITIAATDAYGNTDSITDTFRVDTVAPEAPGVESVTLTSEGVEYLGIDTTDNDVTVSEVTAGHQVNQLADDSDGVALPWGETLFNFDPALSNGSHLVVNETDDAGNSNATYVVMEETGTDVVDLGGLGSFDVGAIDLSFASDSDLTLDLSSLEGLSDADNNLVIHGGSDDAVNLTGAANSGMSTTIDGRSYDIYTMGDDAQIFIEEDINVTI